MVRHPNAGAVLVLSLGCENNNVNEFKKLLGNYNPNRVKFLITQDVEDEVEAGMRLLDELTAYAATFKRQTVDASELVIGLKCGGSDGPFRHHRQPAFRQRFRPAGAPRRHDAADRGAGNVWRGKPS